MAKDNVIAFPQREPEDIYQMTLPQLQALYGELQQVLTALDAKEPEDMESEEYEAWAEEHEDLEDDLDEILDRMEML